MRVAKSNPGLVARYRYDGQMGIEDVEVQGSTTTVTRYGLGARGIDVIERTVGSSVTTGFPIYDAHGNNVATLSRNGTGYSIGDRRSYDAGAWCAPSKARAIPLCGTAQTLAISRTTRAAWCT